MSNKKTGERIGGAIRHREYIIGENWEKGFGEVAQEGGGHQGPAIQLPSNPRDKSMIYRSKRNRKSQKVKR